MVSLSLNAMRRCLKNRRLCRIIHPFYLLFLVIVAGMSTRAIAQVAPTITSINPSFVTAGSPIFTLTVTGTGFSPTSVVQINAANRTTTYVSALQVTATIFASDIAAPGKSQITVFNPLGAGGAGLTSNAVQLTVNAAPSPTLSSAAPGIAAQGIDRIPMTLVGTNFRPGATVVISPPLSTMTNSNGHTKATDVTVVSATVVNSTVMTALISVSPTAAPGLRAVDVLNLDGTSTAGGAAPGGSSQPVTVKPSNSIGAPVSVSNVALIHPRDGTVIMQGDELNAEALLAGTGTGSVTGEWLWDGNVVEQFSTSIVGGRSTSIRTRQSLPTWLLGAHTLQLRMVHPNQVAIRPVEVVVNPGKWKLDQLIEPAYGAGFMANDPPQLLWTPIPGAMKYQVGFSTQPFLSTVRTWFDVVDNRWAVPAKVWKALPEGELYWTVRAVDTSQVPRKAFPMRPIYRMPESSLAPAHALPARTPAGNTLLEWAPAFKSGFYFVTISSDNAATYVLRRYLTANPRLDLRAVDAQLIPGTTYYWQADAIAPNGAITLLGPVQSFVAQAGTHAALLRSASTVLIASLGAPQSLPPQPPPTVQISGQSPAPDSSTNEVQPVISMSFFQPADASGISLMVDGVDITSLAQVSEAKVSFTPPLPLAGGDHTVNLNVGGQATSWKFTVKAPDSSSAPAAPSGTDAEAPPPASSVMPTPDAITAAHQAGAKSQSKRIGPSEDGQIGINTQWSSGSNPPDSNAVTAAEHVTYQQGPWHFEVNGSGLLNSVLNPERLRNSRGKVNDYVIQLGNQGTHWGMGLRFGSVSPVLFTDAQFVTAPTPRQGLELTLNSPAGAFGGFMNTNDEALGGGSGINFRQKLMGASWQAPLPKWAQLHVMWLSGQDLGVAATVALDSFGNPYFVPNPTIPRAAGDVYGGLLNIHLPKTWLWTSEYAISSDNPNIPSSSSTREFGRAWRSGITGQPGKTNVNVAVHDVSPNFGNPANPGLTPASQPNTQGVDAAITQTTAKAGTFGLTYTFLANNHHPTTSDELLLNTFNETWSKPFGPKTTLSLDARQSLTETGTVPLALLHLAPSVTGAQDVRDISGNINLSCQYGTVTMTAGGTRDWSHNYFFPLSNTITSTINAGANLVTKSFFQLNAQGSVNWVSANGATVGDSRNISGNIQPALVFKRPSIQISPLISVTQAQTVLANGTFTNDTFTGQYGGRLAWTLPGWLKFNVLSAQGSYNQNRNNITGINQQTSQLLVLLTTAWDHKHIF